MLRAITRSHPHEWVQFGPQHLFALIVAAVLCVNLFAFRSEAARIRLDVWLVALMAALHLTWVVFAQMSGIASGGDLLPLYTCDASILAGIAWCFWKPRWLGQVIFCWAFLGGVVTLLLPDTFGYALPHFAVIYTLTFHALLLVFGLQIWLIEDVRPAWRAIVPVALVTIALVPPALAANAAFGSDYMFVSRDPGGIFTFLTAFEGAARVGMTFVAGTGVLFIGIAAWFAMDIILRRWDTRKRGAPVSVAPSYV